MGKLKVISSTDLIKLLQRINYDYDHQTGSHIIIRNSNPPFRRLTIPNHKEIAKGTLRKIIREAGISVEEFNSLIEK